MTEVESQKIRVAAILGLDCGLMVYELLTRLDDFDVVHVYGKAPGAAENVAGYIDLAAHVPSEIYTGYDRLRDISENIAELEDLDLIIALGISEIVPPPILAVAPLGCLGVHAAKLPDRPGAAPIVWAILDGLKETAVTLFRMNEGIDTGEIIAVEPVQIKDKDTAGDIRLKCDAAIISMLSAALPGYARGDILARPQDTSKGTYTRRRGPADGELDLGLSGEEILRKIRALGDPYPGAHFYAGDGTPVVIEKARIGDASLHYTDRPSVFAIAPRRVMCVVAHPDDEALGVGGTLIRHILSGDSVDIVILSDGEAAKSDNSVPDPARASKAAAWAKQTRCNLRGHYDFPDQQLDTVPLIDIVRTLEGEIADCKPDIIYTHHPGDMNSDHQIVAQCVLAAKRPMHAEGRLPTVYAFETPSSTDQAPHVVPFLFAPNHYVVLDGLMEQKLSALSIYANELGPPPHPRSLESISALATKRGAECGVLAAEAFVTLRSVWAVL